MPMFDINSILANDVDITGSVNGGDVSMIQGGSLEGLKGGLIVQAQLQFDGAITDPNSDATLNVYIDEKIGSNYRQIAAFPQIGSAQDTNAASDNDDAIFNCFFVPSYNATALRYRTVLGGTGVRVYNDMNIRLYPTNQAPSF